MATTDHLRIKAAKGGDQNQLAEKVMGSYLLFNPAISHILQNTLTPQNPPIVAIRHVL